MVIFLVLFCFYYLEGFSQIPEVRELQREHFLSSHLQDLGVHGTLFEIEEEDLLLIIEKRLKALEKKGELEQHQQHLLKRAEHQILKPKAVKGLKRATENRVFYYDPTLILSYDLKDHKGRVFQKKGTKVNPLTHVSLSKALLFIEGDNPSHLSWVQKTYIDSKKPLKIILVRGEPFKCEKTLRVSCYFDQDGVLIKKLGITHVPASVTQEGTLLRIEEHLVGEEA